jgi:hypothetical protein
MSTESAPSSIELQYAAKGLFRRPGGLKAIGVLSLVVGLLVLAASGALGFGAASEIVSTKWVEVPASSWSPPAAPLNKNQIRILHERLENEYDQLNVEQLASLDQYLASPAQELFFPSYDDQVMRRQLQGVVIRPDDNGAALILTQRGQLRLSKHGRATIQNRPNQAYAFHGIVRHIHYAWLAAAIGEWLMVCVAIFFVVAGIRIWRDPVRGIKLHIRCATVALAVSIAAAIALIIADDNEFYRFLLLLILTLPQTITFIYAAIVLAVLSRENVRKFVDSLDVPSTTLIATTASSPPTP